MHYWKCLFVEIIFPENRVLSDLDNFLFRFFVYPIGYVVRLAVQPIASHCGSSFLSLNFYL